MSRLQTGIQRLRPAKMWLTVFDGKVSTATKNVTYSAVHTDDRCGTNAGCLVDLTDSTPEKYDTGSVNDLI